MVFSDLRTNFVGWHRNIFEKVAVFCPRQAATRSKFIPFENELKNSIPGENRNLSIFRTANNVMYNIIIRLKISQKQTLAYKKTLQE